MSEGSTKREFLAGGLGLVGLIALEGCAGRISTTGVKSPGLCTDKKYDIDKRCINSLQTIDNMTQSVYEIERHVAYDIDSSTSDYYKDFFKKRMRKGRLVMGRGSAVMLKDDFMLTATHVINKKAKDISGLGRYGRVKLKAKDLKHLVKIEGQYYNAEIEMKGEIDSSLIKVKDIPRSYGFPKVKFGKLSGLRSGQLVYAIGNTAGMGIQTKSGDLTKAEDPESFKLLMKYYPKLRSQFGGKHFLINAGISGGDSGGGIYAIRDGLAELIGLTVMGHKKAPIGIGLGIDSVLTELAPKMIKNRLL